MTPERVLCRDVIPYDVPSSLDALRGQVKGTIELPRSVYWGPDSRADLSTPQGVVKAYRNIVREGTTVEQEAYLNADTLRQIWPDLVLPERCRKAWESRFPELSATR